MPLATHWCKILCGLTRVPLRNPVGVRSEVFGSNNDIETCTVYFEKSKIVEFVVHEKWHPLFDPKLPLLNTTITPDHFSWPDDDFMFMVEHYWTRIERMEAVTESSFTTTTTIIENMKHAIAYCSCGCQSIMTTPKMYQGKYYEQECLARENGISMMQVTMMETADILLSVIREEWEFQAMIWLKEEIR